MDHIRDSFRVATSLETTWNTLLDIERIAPCMPGAQLQEVEGDEYRGVVKIKVGPIQAQYKGAARLALVDIDSRIIKIDASGRDTRGQGNASALITVTMVGDETGTTVDIDTELNVTGKVAQFGRGEMPKISAKLLKQFVNSLERDVLGGANTTATSAAAATQDKAAAAPPDTGTNLDASVDSPRAVTVEAGVAAKPETSAAVAPAPGVRKIDAPEPEPIDVLDMAGSSLAKMILPIAGVAIVLFLLFRRRRH